MKKRTCEGCDHFVRLHGAQGECHAHSSIVIGSIPNPAGGFVVTGGWPPTRAEQRCGEFTPKVKEERYAEDTN